MISLEFGTASQLIFRAGALRYLPRLIRSLGASRALIVTDPELVQVGLAASVLTSIDSTAQLSGALFSIVETHPLEKVIYAAAECGRDAKADIIIGLGGGSVMDTAKLVAYLMGGPVNLAAIYGIGFATGRRLPLILVPTTAGTGSEVTPISIVTTSSHEKKEVISPKLLPDIALLDPELTIGLPWHVTAATGIDAMVHAIEAYTSRQKKNMLSDLLASKALGMLALNFPKVLDEPQNLSARGEMLLGSTLAGMAFANASVAAVHALASPLGDRYFVPHGSSNALMLIPVLQFNAEATSVEYGELAAAVGASRRTAEGFIEEMKAVLAQSNLPIRLRDVGVSQDGFDLLAHDAMKQTHLLINNPVEVTFEDARRLYAQAY